METMDLHVNLNRDGFHWRNERQPKEWQKLECRTITDDRVHITGLITK